VDISPLHLQVEIAEQLWAGNESEQEERASMGMVQKEEIEAYVCEQLTFCKCRESCLLAA
jgi:hypothetical protein